MKDSKPVEPSVEECAIKFVDGVYVINGHSFTNTGENHTTCSKCNLVVGAGYFTWKRKERNRHG